MSRLRRVALRCGIRLPYGPTQTPNPDLDKVLYVCIPVYNEAPTIGVLLWRLRSTFQEYSREYEVIVYDDASTDATAETLEPYTRVLPLTVMQSRERIGYAASLDALLRETASRTRYP